MAPYNPPTKWPSVQVPWLTMVLRADPDFERKKHREAEYASWWSGQGRAFYADPYRRGVFNTPQRTMTVNYAGPLTLAAGDITGVGYDFVTMVSTNVAPGTLTTRSAAQMFADIAGAVPNIGHALRIVNNANGGPLTLLGGDGVIFTEGGWQVGSVVVRANTYTDMRVQFPEAADCVMSVDSNGGPYSALVG